MGTDAVSFQELGRVRVSASTEVVMSTVSKNGNIIGININNFITSNVYTGPSKGVFIPNDKIAGFTKLVSSIGA